MNLNNQGSGSLTPQPPTPQRAAGADISISHQCRRASNGAVDKKAMAKVILEVYYSAAEPLSAWHIVEITGCNKDIGVEFIKSNLDMNKLIEEPERKE